MIPLFDEENKNIKKFPCKEINEQLKDKFKIIKEKVNYSPQRKIRIIQSILTFILFIFAYAVISLGFDSIKYGTFKEAWNLNSIFYIVMLIIGLPAVVIKMIISLKYSRFIRDDLMTEINQQFREFNEMHSKYFDIPKDRNRIDILLPVYLNKTNKDNTKQIGQIRENICYDIYLKDDFLCLTDNFNQVSFPLQDLKVEIINEPIAFFPWNKDENYDSIYYKNEGVVLKKKSFTTNSFSRVIIKKDDEEYYFETPSYEYQLLKRYIK